LPRDNGNTCLAKKSQLERVFCRGGLVRDLQDQRGQRGQTPKRRNATRTDRVRATNVSDVLN
jgi:hypothetical protein